jgi:hypothetical protein
MKNSLRSASAVAFAALLAFAFNPYAQAADHGIGTNVPGVGFSPQPPQYFDPLSASDQELNDYGFPSRPDSQIQPEAYASWKRAMSTVKERILPELKLTDRFHEPAQQVVVEPGGVQTSNWSGEGVTTKPTNFDSPDSIHAATIAYIVPVANQAFGKCTGTWVYSATLVGIDGYGGNDVLEAGTNQNALCTGQVVGQYNAWIEWYPLPEMQIVNFPVSPGDTISIAIWASSATRGNAFVLNQTTGQSASFTVAAPKGVQLAGNSAEWAIDRPAIGGKSATLTNYTSTYVSACFAWHVLDYSTILTPGDPSSIQFNMVDDNQLPISSPYTLGTSAFQLIEEGSPRQ